MSNVLTLVFAAVDVSLVLSFVSARSCPVRTENWFTALPVCVHVAGPSGVTDRRRIVPEQVPGKLGVEKKKNRQEADSQHPQSFWVTTCAPNLESDAAVGR